MIDVGSKYRQFYVSRLDAILVSIALGIALFFLFHKAGTFPPPYPWTDESMIAADAVDTLINGPKLLYPAQVAGGSLSAVYLEAAFMALFGKSLLGLRILNALLNVILVGMTYALVRLMFASQGKFFSQLVAGLASCWLAASIWILAMGYIAFIQVVLVPLMAVGCFYLLWRGLQSGRRRWFALSGFMLGLSFYGYLPVLFLPVALVAFFGAEWLISKLDRRRSLLEMYWSQLVWLVVTALIVSVPLLFVFASSPEVFVSRPLTVIVAKTSKSLFKIQDVIANLAETLASFGLSPRRFLLGQTDSLIFDPLTALLFWIGIAVAIRYLKRPAQLFALIWWATLLLPAALSSGTSGWWLMHRGVGSAPVTFIFPSLGLVTVGQWLWTYRPRLISVAGPLLALAVLVFSGFYSYQFYFVDWANRPQTSAVFAKEPVRLAEWLTAEATPDTVYIFPIRPDVSPTTRPELYTVRYLYEGEAAMAFPVFDEATLPETLTDLSAGKSMLKLMLLNRIELDPKGYLDFLLEQHAAESGRETRFGYTIKTYQLKSDSENFSTPSTLVATNVEFGGAIQLVDCLASQPALSAGETLWLTANWTKLLDADQDYSVQFSLVDSHGYTIAQADKPLLSSRSHQLTSHWAVGETATDYYTLPIPAYTPPGDYTLKVVVYNTAGERLAPIDGLADLSSPLTQVTVMPTGLPVEPASLAIGTPVELPVTDNLHIIGIDLSPSTTARPGDQMRVSLAWQATSAPQQDYGLVLGLIGEDGLAYATTPQPLVATQYPTSEWRPGEILLANYTLLLPPSLTSGDYTLAMRLLDLETDSTISDQALQTFAVDSRLHDFGVPNPAHPLNVDFGTTIRLIGYDEPIISDTGQVTVQIYWQCLAEMTESYKVFAHMVDSGDAIVAQSDFIPGGGAAPTTSWISGEIITDTLGLRLPETALHQTHQLVIGLYESVTGVRLPLAHSPGGEDSLVIPELLPGE